MVLLDTVCLERSLYAVQTVGIAFTAFILFLIPLFVIISIYSGKMIKYILSLNLSEKSVNDFVVIDNKMGRWLRIVGVTLCILFFVLYFILQ